MPTPTLSPSRAYAAERETQRAVSASLLRICQRSPFFATLALHARITITDRLPTAATDGRDVFVNPDFFGALAPAAQDGLLLHEVLHAALLHVTRRGTRDPELWNIAADIVVNGMLVRDGYTLPEGGIRDPNKEHLATEEVYELLVREAQQGKRAAAGMSDLLEATLGDGSGQASDADGQAGARPHAPADRAETEGKWKQALQQAQMVTQSSLAGDTPASLRRELDALLASRVDWRSYLWRYLVQTPTDFGAFDRRFVGNGMYLETISGESVHVHVCVDTSGSISRSDITCFMSEVQAILHAYPHLRCDLFYADAALHGPFVVTADSTLPLPKGGGGTDFRPFFAYLDRHADPHAVTLAIYLTDGYGDFPPRAPLLPVLWVVTPNGKDLSAFPFGETVRLLPSI
ncbi:MAG: hydrolase [Candidatus Roseilinea sp.]|nr:MAG: hydrolase [Candidatus Roseilinea sp.]